MQKEEFEGLRSQTVISSRGGRRYHSCKVVFDVIRELMKPPEKGKKKSIGFIAEDNDK